VPAEQRAEGAIYPRYEDVVQDGRMALVALPQSLGMVVWRKLLSNHPITRVARNQQGIMTVLSRLTIEGGGGPISVFRPLAAEGSYQLAHTRDERGEVNRLMLNMFTTVSGTVGRTNGPPPANHGEPVFVGRVFGEHVCTRLFAPPGGRKVTRFEV